MGTREHRSERSFQNEAPSDNPDNNRILRIEAGYLLSDNSEVFEENTFKLGLNWSVGKSVFVSPSIYFPGEFDRVFPGVRVGIGF